MANNYCQFSEFLELPRGFEKRAQAILEELQELADEEDIEELPFGFNINWEVDRSGVWFYTEESGDPETLVYAVQRLMKAFDIKKPFIASWAFTCSKPRLEEFGGGAVAVWQDHVEWIDARSEIQKRVERREKRKKAKQRKGA